MDMFRTDDYYEFNNFATRKILELENVELTETMLKIDEELREKTFREFDAEWLICICANGR